MALIVSALYVLGWKTITVTEQFRERFMVKFPKSRSG